MSSNKFWKGVVIGAIVGGAVTLFNKDVREQVAEDGKRVGAKIKNVVSNPKQTVECVQNKVNEITQAYKNFSEDLQFITEKANEIKSLSQETINTIQELKESDNNENNVSQTPH